MESGSAPVSLLRRMLCIGRGQIQSTILQVNQLRLELVQESLQGTIESDGGGEVLAAFLSDCTRIYGDRYDYSRVRLTRNHDTVTIICRQHGPFRLRARDHVQRLRGCPSCPCRWRTDVPCSPFRLGFAYGLM